MLSENRGKKEKCSHAGCLLDCSLKLPHSARFAIIMTTTTTTGLGMWANEMVFAADRDEKEVCVCASVEY